MLVYWFVYVTNFKHLKSSPPFVRLFFIHTSPIKTLAFQRVLITGGCLRIGTYRPLISSWMSLVASLNSYISCNYDTCFFWNHVLLSWISNYLNMWCIKYKFGIPSMKAQWKGRKKDGGQKWGKMTNCQVLKWSF